MSARLLALTLGLVYTVESLWLSLVWDTIYMIANNKKMIEENGPLRIFINSTQLLNNDDIIVLFNQWVNNTCQSFRIHARKNEDTWFTMYFSGKCYFYMKDDLTDVRIIYLVNLSEDAKVTHVLLAFAPPKATAHELSAEGYQNFINYAKEKKFPIKNIIKVPKPDICYQGYKENVDTH